MKNLQCCQSTLCVPRPAQDVLAIVHEPRVPTRRPGLPPICGKLCEVPPVGPWRSWERASMASRRSWVRIPSAPPKVLGLAVLYLHSPKPNNESLLYRPNHFPRGEIGLPQCELLQVLEEPRPLETGLLGTIHHAKRRRAQRKPTQGMERPVNDRALGKRVPVKPGRS